MCGGLLPQNWKLLLDRYLLLWDLLLDGAGGSAGSVLGSSESLMSGQETSLVVASIEGVDEGVDTSAVSAVWDKVGVQRTGWGSLGCKVSSVAVEGKVAVGGVVGVDEGVEVGVNILLNIIVITDLGLGLLDWDLLGADLLLLWLLLDLLNNLDGCLWLLKFLSVEGSSGLSVGGNVGTVENPESVLASGVLNGVGLAVLANVGVFAEPVAVDVGFFPEDMAVLCGEGSSCAAVSGVESLLLQDLGILRVDLGAAGSDDASKNNQSKHFEIVEVVETIFHTSSLFLKGKKVNKEYNN